MYDPKENEVNALRCVHLRNTTDMVLAPGSISVLQNGRFVGQTDFTPMIPGDDTLVPYGEDSTVSVLRSTPKDKQTNTVVSLSPVATAVTEARSRVVGCKITHKKTITTVYTVVNNSGTRDVPKFYVDHSAKSQHGGYQITTKEGCVKAVTGFGRFELSLAPSEEKQLEVEEQATYQRLLTGTGEIESFLRDEAPALQSAGVLDAELHARLHYLVRIKKCQNAVSSVQSYRGFGSASARDKLELAATVAASDNQPFAGKLQELLNLAKRTSEIEQTLSEKRRQMRQLEEQRSVIFSNQKRLRENLESLSEHQSSTLVRRYLADMDREEDELISARKRMQALDEEQTKAKQLESANRHQTEQAAGALLEQLKAL